MDFLKERLGGQIDGYEFVKVQDYKKDPDVGQLIMLTDKDVEELSNYIYSKT